MKLKKKALKDFNQVVSARTALGVLTKGNKHEKAEPLWTPLFFLKNE